MPEQIETDVAIIGAGPCRPVRRLRVRHAQARAPCLIDSLSEVGGQCAALYPEKPIYDIPAHPAIAAGHLIENLGRADRPLRRAPPARPPGGGLNGHGRRLHPAHGPGRHVRAKAVLLAAGAGAFGPNRPPARRAPAVRGHRRGSSTSSASGRTTATAASSSPAAATQPSTGRSASRTSRPRSTWSTAGQVPRRAETAAQLEAGGGGRRDRDWSSPTSCTRCTAPTAARTAVEVVDLAGGTRTARGGPPALRSSASRWTWARSPLGPRPAPQPRPRHPATCETSVPGVFAIGDVATYPGKLKLILQGFSEAPWPPTRSTPSSTPTPRSTSNTAPARACPWPT